MPDNTSVYVAAIETLQELRTALLRFQSETHDAVKNAQPQITAALDWLQERLRYWQHQLRTRQAALEQAMAELSRCLSWRGPNGEGANCSGLAAAVRQAECKVQEAQEAIRTAQTHIKRVQEANDEYQRQAHRFKITLTSSELPQASAFLGNSISILQSYISLPTPPIARSSSSGTANASASSVANKVLRLVASGIVALDIVGAAALAPAAGTTDMPESLEPPGASTSAENPSPILPIAKLTEQGVHDVYEAEDKKEEIQDDIEKSLQQGQRGASPPEKL